jgi:hypothetical protein
MTSQGLGSQSGKFVDSPQAFFMRKWIFKKASSRPLPTVFTITELPAKLPRASFPLVSGGGQTTNAVALVLQDYKPLRCITMVHTSTE